MSGTARLPEDRPANVLPPCQGGIEGGRLAHPTIAAATVLESIPHREPFLFVDEVGEATERSIRARKYIDPSWDLFRGHYPGEPIMPGVLLCECCFQAGALLMANRGGSPGIAKPVLTRIQDARFKRIVRPGETLEIEVALDDEVDNAFYMTGRASVAGEMAVRVSFACMAAADSEREA